MKCEAIIEQLERLSPPEYACDWDNVGLLVGRRDKEVKSVMIALDATSEIVQCAVQEKVDMLITHHPMIFSAVKQINEENFTTRKVLALVEHGISYYAMHTNFDIMGGMAQLACGPQFLNLSQTKPIVCELGQVEGLGRYGQLPCPMNAEQVAQMVKERFAIPYVMLYQAESCKDKLYDRIAVLPGSGRSEIDQVHKDGYELYLTGDYTHHDGIDAMDMGITVIDATHYGLEHIFIRYISEYLTQCFGQESLRIVEQDVGVPAKIL